MTNDTDDVLDRRFFPFINRIYLPLTHFPAGIYLFKVNDGDTRTICEICSQLTMKISERRHWRRSGGIFVVNVEQI